jgi:hypothetical protein
MKSVFEPEAFAELVGRIERLPASAARQWGTMSVSQALEHLARAVEMASGRLPQKQALVGRLVSWAIKGKFLGDAPFPRSAPTGPDFVVPNEPEFQATKARLLDVLRRFHAAGAPACDGNVHRFFGRLTGVEWGIVEFKHTDHHLRQFGG